MLTFKNKVKNVTFIYYLSFVQLSVIIINITDLHGYLVLGVYNRKQLWAAVRVSYFRLCSLRFLQFCSIPVKKTILA